MNPSSDPTRFRDGGDPGDDYSGELRSLAMDLATHAGSPSEAQLASLLARLAPSEEPAILQRPEPAPKPALRGKLWLLSFALLGLGALYFGWQQATEAVVLERTPKPDLRLESTSLAETTSLPPSDTAATIADTSLALSKAAPAREPRPATKKHDRPPRANAAPSVDAQDPVAELTLLTRARRVLLTEPARTLSLVEEHAQHYPQGLFAEEREVLGVEALLRAKHTTEAAVRAQRFLREHSGSAHAVRMRELLHAADVR